MHVRLTYSWDRYLAAALVSRADENISYITKADLMQSMQSDRKSLKRISKHLLGWGTALPVNCKMLAICTTLITQSAVLHGGGAGSALDVCSSAPGRPGGGGGGGSPEREVES